MPRHDHEVTGLAGLGASNDVVGVDAQMVSEQKVFPVGPPSTRLVIELAGLTHAALCAEFSLAHSKPMALLSQSITHCHACGRVTLFIVHASDLTVNETVIVQATTAGFL